MKRKQCLMLATSALAALVGRAGRASAACDNPAETFVTNVVKTFAAGSTWSFSVYDRACEGLTIRGATFTPFGGTATTILHTGTIAEVHVPYHSGTPRFLDVTDSTDGLGAGAMFLLPDECPGGTLFELNPQDASMGKICVRDEVGGFGWKMDGQFRVKESVEVYMSSQLGKYNYINRWTFHDDGMIEPETGLTGTLQEIRSTTPPQTDYRPWGRRLNQEFQNEVMVGKSHMHNFYYRLDFDIGGAAGDAVSRVTFTPSTQASPESSCAVTGQCGKNTFTQILNEKAETWSPTDQTSWFVFDKTTLNADGRPIGMEIKPHISGIWRGMTGFGGGESWTNAELWVTAFNGCERFAARNLGARLGGGCAGAAQNVTTMLNNQSVDGQDLVVWYVNRVQHVPRDEDEFNMPIEWVGFEIEPRQLFHQNPAP